MKNSKVNKLLTLAAFGSMLITPVVSVVSAGEVQKNTNQININADSKNYLQELSSTINENNSAKTKGFEESTEKLLASFRSSKTGTILVDRNSAEHMVVLQNAILEMKSTNASKSFKNKKVWKLDLRSIIANSKSGLEVTSKLKQVFDLAENSNGN